MQSSRLQCTLLALIYKDLVSYLLVLSICFSLFLAVLGLSYVLYTFLSAPV